MFGSSGGLGKSIYEVFKKNNQKVIGIDINNSAYSDIICDLSCRNEIKNLSLKITDKIDSITFCHAIGNSKNEIDNYSDDQFRFVNAESNFEVVNLFLKNLNQNCSIIFISSIHSKLTNSASSKYALSKVYLEGLYKRMCLSEDFTNINKSLLRIGAMNTNMLKKNVHDLESLKSSIPSKRIIEPASLALFIYNFHKFYSEDFDCSILNIDNGVSFKLSTD